MGFSKSSKVMVMAIIVAIMLHTFSVGATAMIHNTKPNAKLGRRLMQNNPPVARGYGPFNPPVRGGYGPYNPPPN